MTTQPQSPIVLVDGSSYLYRAFHAMYKADLRTQSGQPTGAVRGVVSMLKSLEKQYPKSVIAVIFDAKGKTFRDDIYPEYKAQRPPMPDDLRLQIEPVHEIIKAMGMPLICVSGVEADDVIGTYAKQATEAKLDIVISTGDKDMAQLVNEHVTLVNTMTETVMDVAGVNEKFGIPPELIIDFLALMGDKVDNIPGVAGVGEKTALALLQGLGSINDIYDNLDAVPALGFRGSKKMPEKLEAEKDMALLSYELATIKCDVELDESIEQLMNLPADTSALTTWFTDLEFKSWVAELSGGLVTKGEAQSDIQSEIVAAPAIDCEYETVLTQEQFDSWVEKITAADYFAFDTETTSLNFMKAEVVGVSLSVEIGKAAYIPFAHDYDDAPLQLDRTEVLNRLKPLLELNAAKDNAKVIGQNLKYDAHVLRHYNIDLTAIKADTMIMSYIVNSTATRHNMDALSNKYLGVKTVKFEDIAGKGKKQLTFNQIDLEPAAHYAAEDADITLRLFEVLQPLLNEEPKLRQLYNELELPLISVLTEVEHTGVELDADKLFEQSQELDAAIIQLEQQAFNLAGEEFNLGSPKQLQVILFEKLGLPVRKKTPKGQPSTAEPVLQELANDYELPSVIMQYRSLSKLKSTYTDALPAQINPKTQRVHTSYHQAVTATGRLSSSDPNLQNIPIRTEEGRKVRQAFVAPQGKKLIAADYSQIELRIMAHLSADAGLLTAFNKGLDVHKATAAEVFSVPLDEVVTAQRRSAKAINFGLIYGMSAFGLAKQLKINRNEAQRYIDAYFERYTGVQTYMNNIRAQAHEDGYVETLRGRRLYLPEINAKNKMMQQAAERTAINGPMQGTAADIIKQAMLDIAIWIEGTDLDVTLLMQVHDELVFEVAEADVEKASEAIKRIMESAITLDVPLLVELGTGDNWDEAH
ncbi:MAG: DNA polymerase I [Sinobacterium sp.]|nr:DNA polymerase I [Sinobacterium sp.]